MATYQQEMNPVWLAQSRLRRRRFDEAIEICTNILEKNPYDQAVWYLKCRALTLKNWIDDTEIEEQGVADLLLDENQVAQVARPGTSLSRPLTSAAGAGGAAGSLRPNTGSVRPLTGFARPGTSSRPASQSGAGGGLEGMLRANRSAAPGTAGARPVTSSGRFVRLGTASMVSEPGGPFIAVERLDLRKYAQRPLLARALLDYIVYVEHNMRKALELCAAATQAANYEDWWWKCRLGRAYYALGLLRDAERQYASSIKNQEMVGTVLELCKVYVRLDQPNTALEALSAALGSNPGNTSLLIAVARLHDGLGDMDAGVQVYKDVLFHDSSNVEAIACLGSYHFYSDQPEVALRYYRRLLQMGVTSCQLWNNLGLCTFYASHYDLTLSCFERALATAEEDGESADVWYNLGQLAVGIGDANLGYQAFKVAAALDPDHAEALNNLGVLEARRGADAQARASYRSAQQAAGHVYEAFYNGGLAAFRAGEFQEAYEMVGKALAACPDHTESLELSRQLANTFALL